MPLFRDFLDKVKIPRFPHKTLYHASLMLFFWSIFDGIISYVTPLVITEKGLSKTTMGIIYSSSSVAGAIFDFLLSKFLPNTHWRRLFLLMFAVCSIYPLLLWRAGTVFVFVIAMAIWGLYYDLLSFGSFDFVSRNSTAADHCQSFGILTVFKSLGYLIAPILAGLLVSQVVGAKPFLASFLFLLVAFIFFVLLFCSKEKDLHQIPEVKTYKPLNFLCEFYLWKKVGIILLPVLIFTVLIYIFDAFFWTIGPLYSQTFSNFADFGGLFMAMYTLPILLTGWLVGPITQKFGKKRTAFF